jgi:predicted CXXCH cytochrome family protein
MKAFKFSLVIVAVAITIIGFSGSAGAFHSGGVAECVGCHSMHSAPQGGSYLLVGTDQSSACLSCHEVAGLITPSSYHVSTADGDMPAGVAPRQRTPGGDFGWLKKSYTMTIRGTTTTEAGETHGHNIVAVDKGYVADSVNTTAPGGTMASSQLGCHSCHDPHGKYRRLSNGTIATTGAPIIASGSYHNSVTPGAGEAVGVYRLLAGAGYSRGGSSFGAVNPPIAVTNSTYNRTEATTQTRTAYGRGMSDWCASCHPNMHTNSGRLVHPVNQNLGSSIAANYNTYVGSGNMGGSIAASYLSLVPYEENSTDYTALKALAATSGTAAIAGPASNAQVQCLSCHRAHASGFPEMTRWSNEGEFITYQGAWPGTDTTPSVPQFARGRLGAETLAAYNDIPATKFATYQRSLCNKCHAQD